MLMEKGRKGKRILAKEACLLTLMYVLDNTRMDSWNKMKWGIYNMSLILTLFKKTYNHWSVTTLEKNKAAL